MKITDLSITLPGDVELFKQASLELRPGEIVLVVGESGKGKSTLLKLLGGVLPSAARKWAISGTLETDGERIDLSGPPNTHGGGYVFQDYALFDELTGQENIDIGEHHARPDEAEPRELPRRLLEGIDLNRIVRDNSGGQKQRIAIVRTLQANKSVMLYDEPNSGLDINASAEFARMASAVARETDTPALIVAHHYHHLLPIADRVLAIDSERKTLLELKKDPAEVERFFAGLATTTPPGEPDSEKKPEKPAKHREHWFFFYGMHYFMTLLFSPKVLWFMATGGLLAGFVATWFLFQHFPYREVLLPVVHDSTIQTLGYVQFRILIPLITAILLAARNSAIITADLGNRVFSNQLLAMRNLNIPAWRYLTLNIFINMILACLVYTALNFLLCYSISLATWKFIHPAQPWEAWSLVYFDLILPRPGIPEGLGWVLGKMTVSGFAIALFSTYFGRTDKRSVLDINEGIASAIIASTTAVLVIHAVFAMVEL